MRQVGAAGDQTFLDVAVSDDLEQFVELRHTQALADVGLEQTLALAGRKRVCALQVDGLDREAAAVDRGLGGHRSGGFTRQILEFFKTAALFFEEAILAITNQVGVARRGSRVGGEGETGDDNGQCNNSTRPEK